MREVETQPIRRHERALLLHVIAQHAPQRLMQDVRRRVIGARRAAARMVDFENESGALGESRLARLLQHALMHDQIAELLMRRTRRETAAPAP